MIDRSQGTKEKEILLLAPTGNDSDVAREVLSKASLICIPCFSMEEICSKIHDETGAIVIAEEALSPSEVSILTKCLNDQPPWSDLPVIVLTLSREPKRFQAWGDGMFGPRANVTLLERPFHTTTLLSILHVALRARSRQFELRELLKQRQSLFEMEKKARAEAEQTNRAKDEFLATLSHELRTPLTTILGWSKILSSNRLNETATARASAAIERSARSQAQLIDDLLDVSRIITGKFQIDKKNVDLVELIQSSIDMVRPAAESKGIRLEVRLTDNPGPISGDFHRLQQVLWNILSNAIKFTSNGGLIFVEMERTNSHASIFVRDTGKGISADFLPHIFERFRQLDSSYTRNEGGLGLGLAIVQYIVNLHGGTVKAESEGEGKGSQFTVILPVKAEGVQPLSDTSSKRKSKKASYNLDDVKLLLLEDDEESRELIEVILKQGNATVRSVGSVKDAFELLSDWVPEIIISDIGMPEEDGYVFISRLRSHLTLSNIPVIALTAYASSNDREKALKAGFQIHLTKPLDPSRLLEAVAKLSSKK